MVIIITAFVEGESRLFHGNDDDVDEQVLKKWPLENMKLD